MYMITSRDLSQKIDGKIIEVEEELFHAPHLTTEGCGVISPKLTVELNKAGSLEFTVPPNHIHYSNPDNPDKIKKLKTIITVYDDGKEIFRGRILHDEKDFYNQRKVYCEGELAFLLDSVQRPVDSFKGTLDELFRSYIANHNKQMKNEPDKQFTVGKIDIDEEILKEEITLSKTSHVKTIDAITENMLNLVGGYLKIRLSGDTRYIDWLKDSGEYSSQTIEFGVNLLDLTEHITAENIYTVLIPIGASMQNAAGEDIGKLSIKTDTYKYDYVENAKGIELFGRIENTAEWSEVTDAGELKRLAQELLDNSIKMAVTLELRAVDLHFIDVDTSQIRLGDWVRVISFPHGLNEDFQCTKIVYDLTSPDQTEYTFGMSFTSLTDKEVGKEKNMQSAINQATQAANKAENIIAQVPTGVIPTSTIDNIWSNKFNK